MMVLVTWGLQSRYAHKPVTAIVECTVSGNSGCPLYEFLMGLYDEGYTEVGVWHARCPHDVCDGSGFVENVYGDKESCWSCQDFMYNVQGALPTDMEMYWHDPTEGS